MAYGQEPMPSRLAIFEYYGAELSSSLLTHVLICRQCVQKFYATLRMRLDIRREDDSPLSSLHQRKEGVRALNLPQIQVWYNDTNI